MTDYKEILRLDALGFSKQALQTSCVACARNTVRSVISAAQGKQVTWQSAKGSSNENLRNRLYPSSSGSQQYRMPDYEQIHREMQKSGVTLSLLWAEYCDQCRAAGELPYQSTQFNKYYADFVSKTKATMHLEHKPGETMQVDWAGQTTGITDTDTGELIPAFLLWPFCLQRICVCRGVPDEETGGVIRPMFMRIGSSAASRYPDPKLETGVIRTPEMNGHQLDLP
jgi:bacterioferritin-associated ferredoxin